MALSGTETTRIGGYLHGVGKRLSMTAKAEFTPPGPIRKTLPAIGTKIGSRQTHASAVKG